jgi:hypothetical protein
MSIPLPQDPNAQPQQAPQPSIEEIIQLLLSQMQDGGPVPSDEGTEAVDNPQEDALEAPVGADPAGTPGQDPQALMQAVLQLLSTKDKQAQGLHQPNA